jgi:hypothetical protein
MSINFRSTEHVHNPLFRLGYGEIWRGDESAISPLWQAEDLEQYKAGRSFGLYVLTEAKQHVPLLTRNWINSRCLELMVLWNKDRVGA